MTTDPQDELLDVVDTENRVVGSASRAEVHRMGLRHRACHMIVFDTEARVLVQKRSMTKDNNPGLWDSSSAGHVDSGEDYVACALRELNEELGLATSADCLEKVFLLPASPLTDMEFAQVFTLVTDAPISADPVEITELRWCSSEELDQWITTAASDFTEVFREIWNRLNMA